MTRFKAVRAEAQSG